MCCTTPELPSMAKSTSGIKQTSTSPLASEAWRAMNPDWRPMSFTTPTPLSADLASTAAALIAFCASSTAVSNPNVLSMCRMSLSIVLGMPTTDTFNPLLAHSSLMALAPACEPLPPMTNTMFIPCASIESTILGTSPPPRPVPMTEPPWRCNPLVFFLVRRMVSTPSRQNPPKPYRTPEIFVTPYPTSSVVTIDRTTSLIPGHRPPQLSLIHI